MSETKISIMRPTELGGPAVIRKISAEMLPVEHGLLAGTQELVLVVGNDTVRFWPFDREVIEALGHRLLKLAEADA